MTAACLEDDLAERALVSLERATGERADTCPWRAVLHPYVQAVIRAHRHWEHGELGSLHPGGVPAALLWGVEEFDAALGALQGHDMREEREERERAAREAVGRADRSRRGRGPR